MRITVVLFLAVSMVAVTGVYAAPSAQQEEQAVANGSASNPAGTIEPLELGDYGDSDYIAPAIGYGVADRDVMPTYEDYDEETGMPDVTPSDAVGEF